MENNLEESLSHLAFSLCDIPSLTFDEGAVLDFIVQWSRKHNFHCEKISLDTKRFNLLIAVKKRPLYRTLLCTHVDTVPPFIAPSIEDGLLKGRGACDAKGIAACMLLVLKKMQNEGVDDVAVLLTVGEEEASDGAKKCNALLKGRARTVIVGEPTSLKAARAQKGSLVFDIVVQGKEAHSSLPAHGFSASHDMIHVLESMLKERWPKNDRFGETLLNIGMLKAGRARNTFAAEARAQCIMRLSESAEQILISLQSHLNSNTRLEIFSRSDPFDYKIPDGVPTFIAGFGSDAPYLRDVGSEIMLIGPGSLEVAHQENEFMLINDIVSAYFMYLKMIRLEL
ncbi:MAG: M20/M25/M40 family metallo-hydrolase [Myxococcales bacterium]|nr:M20/M25/M40 family metallo-hydrolase [Myxococcales bacterium]USN50384.1 MAG: M20/M25/M40 family metallo-hydrolase [Myxococcales bacterium]